MKRTLHLKKEVLAELTTNELRDVIAGNNAAISQNVAICGLISLANVTDCLRLTCGEGCTNRSTIEVL